MKLFKIFSSSANNNSITAEDIRQYKKLRFYMKLKRMEADGMLNMTNGETIFRVTCETIDRATKSLEKVIRRGRGQYKPGSKTSMLVAEAERMKKEYENMAIKMQIKLRPSKAEEVIEQWLSVTTSNGTEENKAADTKTSSIEIPECVADTAANCRKKSPPVEPKKINYNVEKWYNYTVNDRDEEQKMAEIKANNLKVEKWLKDTMGRSDTENITVVTKPSSVKAKKWHKYHVGGRGEEKKTVEVEKGIVNTLPKPQQHRVYLEVIV
ncbi:hypothetical protein CRE_14799 [Caenorhabditis remanei]|uniref:Uncharacterized protein n=1 Tax=Caenorhabditis remanei TaxID=31234 RepID=E3MRT1_CAERE|nr:hypothetical protein CRE_14799 [Caenorhabditis remanei]